MRRAIGIRKKKPHESPYVNLGRAEGTREERKVGTEGSRLEKNGTALSFPSYLESFALRGPVREREDTIWRT